MIAPSAKLSSGHEAPRSNRRHGQHTCPQNRRPVTTRPSPATQVSGEPRAVRPTNYPGRPDQVWRARRDVARHLAGHPASDDAVLITSELASNAVLHSRSKGQFFTVRAEIFPGYLWLE